MTLLPHFDTPGVILRFAAGPQLRVWLDTPDGRHLVRVEFALVENETWQVHGAIDGLPGWTWQATITPRDDPATRWHHQLEISAASGLRCSVTVALTDLGTSREQSDPAINAIAADHVCAAVLDTGRTRHIMIDPIHNTGLSLRSAFGPEAGQTLVIEHDLTLTPQPIDPQATDHREWLDASRRRPASGTSSRTDRP